MNSGCDLALTIGHLRDTSLVARRIAETDAHIFASPAYLQARGNPRTPAELAQLDCLTLNAETGTTTWRLSRADQQFEVPVRSKIAVDDGDALLACAKAGLGCMIVADWLPRQAVERGELVRVLADYQVEPRGSPINVLYVSRSCVPQKVRAFIDFYAAKALAQFGPLRNFDGPPAAGALPTGKRAGGRQPPAAS